MWRVIPRRAGRRGPRSRVGAKRGSIAPTSTRPTWSSTSGGRQRHEASAGIHRKPDLREQLACRPWLDAELDQVRPTVLVVPRRDRGASASCGRSFRVDPGSWPVRRVAARSVRHGDRAPVIDPSRSRRRAGGSDARVHRGPQEGREGIATGCVTAAARATARSIPQPFQVPTVVLAVEVQVPHRPAPGLDPPVLAVATVRPPAALDPPLPDHVADLVAPARATRRPTACLRRVRPEPPRRIASSSLRSLARSVPLAPYRLEHMFEGGGRRYSRARTSVKTTVAPRKLHAARRTALRSVAGSMGKHHRRPQRAGEPRSADAPGDAVAIRETLGRPGLVRAAGRRRAATTPTCRCSTCPPRVTCKTPVGHDGTPLRIPTEDWTLAGRAASDTRVLSFAFPDTPYAVILGFDSDGAAAELLHQPPDPARALPGGVRHGEHLLDVTIPPIGPAGRGRTRTSSRRPSSAGCSPTRTPPGSGTGASGRWSTCLLREPPFDRDWSDWRPDPAWDGRSPAAGLGSERQPDHTALAGNRFRSSRRSIRPFRPTARGGSSMDDSGGFGAPPPPPPPSAGGGGSIPQRGLGEILSDGVRGLQGQRGEADPIVAIVVVPLTFLSALLTQVRSSGTARRRTVDLGEERPRERTATVSFGRSLLVARSRASSPSRSSSCCRRRSPAAPRARCRPGRRRERQLPVRVLAVRQRDRALLAGRARRRDRDSSC